jgi:hypothetical protein
MGEDLLQSTFFFVKQNESYRFDEFGARDFAKDIPHSNTR